MSAFLGPIHYWLYNKIRLQQEIINELYRLGEGNNIPLKSEAESRFGVIEDKPLEEMIDQGNIHGWLQERVSQVEYKYAFVVTALANKLPDAIHTLKSSLYNAGKEQAKAIDHSSEKLKANELFKLITDLLLDGMPCDHANRILSQNDYDITWTRNLCVHAPYWDDLEGDISIYYELRESWLMGFIGTFGYSLEKIDDTTYRLYTSK